MIQTQTRKPNLEEAITNMNSLTNENFRWEVREGLVTLGLRDLKTKYNTAWIVRDYVQFIDGIKSGSPDKYLEDDLRIDNLHGWLRGSSSNKDNYFYETNFDIHKLLTPQANEICSKVLKYVLNNSPAPRVEDYESDACIESSQTQFWSHDLKQIGETSEGLTVLGSPLSFVIHQRREGCYDTGRWTSIQHGLTTSKNAILEKVV